MEKKRVIKLKFKVFDRRKSEWRWDELTLLASVERIYESTYRYYMNNGTPIAYKLSFPTPRISMDEMENERFIDSLENIEINGWDYKILKVDYTNKRTIIDLRALV